MSERAAWCNARLRIAATGLLMVFLTGPSGAHVSLRDFIQHRLSVEVSRSNIGVTVELTFNEHCAEHERAAMDLDRDGRVGLEEVQRYVAARYEPLEEGLKLEVDGVPLPAALRYDPEVDLLGDPRTGAHAFVLRLHYFARTPDRYRDGAVLTVREGLWPEQQALRSVEVVGRGEVRLTALPEQNAGEWRIRRTDSTGVEAVQGKAASAKRG